MLRAHTVWLCGSPRKFGHIAVEHWLWISGACMHLPGYLTNASSTSDPNLKSLPLESWPYPGRIRLLPSSAPVGTVGISHKSVLFWLYLLLYKPHTLSPITVYRPHTAPSPYWSPCLPSPRNFLAPAWPGSLRPACHSCHYTPPLPSAMEFPKVQLDNLQNLLRAMFWCGFQSPLNTYEIGPPWVVPREMGIWQALQWCWCRQLRTTE